MNISKLNTLHKKRTGYLMISIGGKFHPYINYSYWNIVLELPLPHLLQGFDAFRKAGNSNSGPAMTQRHLWRCATALYSVQLNLTYLSIGLLIRNWRSRTGWDGESYARFPWFLLHRSTRYTRQSQSCGYGWCSSALSPVPRDISDNWCSCRLQSTETTLPYPLHQTYTGLRGSKRSLLLNYRI